MIELVASTHGDRLVDRVRLAFGRVGVQPPQRAGQLVGLGPGEPASEPTVEGDRCVAQVVEQFFARIGERDVLDPSIGRVAAAHDQPGRLHGVEVVGQRRAAVHLRAGQINGCSACVDAGIDTATKAGVSPEKLLTVVAWYENPIFDDAERAALALTEAATRLADRPGAVTDEIWDDAARYYDERQLAGLVLMIAITNFFNRINTTYRTPAGTRWD